MFFCIYTDFLKHRIYPPDSELDDKVFKNASLNSWLIVQASQLTSYSVSKEDFIYFYKMLYQKTYFYIFDESYQGQVPKSAITLDKNCV